MIINVNDRWCESHPGAGAGVLLVRVSGNPTSPEQLSALEGARRELEADLRQRFAGASRADIAALPVVQAYDRYYRRFDKTYVVQAQLESVALKGKSIPAISGLVEAMFMAEIKNQILTAGHDADKLSLPLTLDSAAGGEEYTLLRGQPQTLKPGDMFMADREGIVSSVIYGPDRRTQITPETTRALYAVYTPPGVDREILQTHLADMESYVCLFCPDAQVEFRVVESAEG